LIAFITRLLSKYRTVNWALADQAMVSGTNFFTGLLLARYMGLEEFGVFTLVWIAILLLSNLQLAMVISPMMSIGPKQTCDEAPAYYGAMFLTQILFSAISFLLLFVGITISGMFFPQWQVQHLALPLASVAFFFQMQDFIRRYFFASNCATYAFANDAISYLGQLVILIWLLKATALNSAGALWIIAGTSALAALVGSFYLGKLSWDSRIFYSSTERHFQFSKWLSISAFMQFGAVNYFILVAASLWGPSAAGALKATQNIIGVTHILFQGLYNVVPPEASRRYQQEGIRGVLIYLRKISWLGGGATTIIALLIGVFSELWLNLVYGEEFVSYGYILKWYAIIYVLAFFSVPLHTWFRVLEYTQPIFWATLSMLLFSLSSANILSELWGLHGTIIGIFMSFILLQIILVVAVYRKYKEIMVVNLK